MKPTWSLLTTVLFLGCAVDLDPSERTGGAIGIDPSEQAGGAIDQACTWERPEQAADCTDGWCITCFVAADDPAWDIVGLVQRFEARAQTVAPILWSKTEAAADLGMWIHFSVNFVQPASDEVPETAVEITTGLLDVPYEDLDGVLPVANWGLHLAGRVGGEIVPYAWDSQGRVVRQLERMVLDPLQLGIDAGSLNNDMTKVEVIEYEDRAATVYWRVIYSDPPEPGTVGGTEVDVGSVRFEAEGGRTRVTFHSGHRLRTKYGDHLPSLLVAPLLSVSFSNHVAQYQADTQRTFDEWFDSWWND